MDYLKITPLEHVLLEIERDLRDLDSSDIMTRLRFCLKEGQNMSQYLNVNKNG